MATARQSALTRDEPDPEQPSLQDLLKASKIIDQNIDTEAQRELKINAMADHNLVEGPTGKQMTAKKQEDALSLANQQVLAKDQELEELRARLAQLEANKPVEQEQQTEVPAIPKAPAVGTEPNPFA